jgi:hypothetical protein
VWTLLRLLARFRGVLGTGDHLTTKSGIRKQRVSTLRNRLRTTLALEGDPFQPTRRGQPYRARFTIRDGSAVVFPTPPGAGWDDITITEVAPEVVEVEVTVAGRGVAFVPDQEDGGRREGTTDSGSREIHYTLADLGLSESEEFTPAGAALVDLLRAGGRLRRPTDDSAMLALGAALTRFFQFSDPPFEYDEKRRHWVARFDATSVVSVSDR